MKKKKRKRKRKRKRKKEKRKRCYSGIFCFNYVTSVCGSEILKNAPLSKTKQINIEDSIILFSSTVRIHII